MKMDKVKLHIEERTHALWVFMRDNAQSLDCERNTKILQGILTDSVDPLHSDINQLDEIVKRLRSENRKLKKTISVLEEELSSTEETDAENAAK